ncbi:hypothetical protein [Mucilaginibacter sp.]
MNKQQLLAGQWFNYKGHFQRIAKEPWRYEPARENLINKKATEYWFIEDVLEDKFYVRHPNFGKFSILYKECEVIQEVAA